MTLIRAVVADDDDLTRAAMVEALRQDGRFEVGLEVSSGTELEAVLDGYDPDVVLLDVRMPGGGAPAASALRAGHPRLVVVAVSAYVEVSTVAGLLRAGATGYLGKGRLGGSLPELVARCVQGEVVLAVPHGAAVLRELANAPSVTGSR